MSDDEIKSEARAGALRIIKGGDNRPEIEVDHDLSDMTDKAAELLENDGEIYQRGGELVHVVTPTPAPGAQSVPVIRPLPVATLRVRLSQLVRWTKVDAKGNAKRTAVPEAIVQALHARGQWHKVPPLVGVLTAPTIRPDGSVLQLPGYDEATALILWPSLRFVDVPEHPTLEDAQGAAEAIMDLVCDFPFAGDADRSAWLAGVLTLVGRAAISGPCPLFAVDANTRGSGKSLLSDVAVMLAHGHKAERSSLSSVDEEMRKQITSLLALGAPSILIDNLKSADKIGGPAFDALLTSDTWRDRNLGKTMMLTLPARAVWWCTGNNLQFAGDLTRRSLRIRLESPLEDPELREGFKYPDLVEHVERSRRFLVTQALIVLRAHAVAGRPRCGAVWGSFESWSRVVAAAVRWLGYRDPLDARATIDESADEERLHAAAIIAGLDAIGLPLTAREIVTTLYPNGYFDGDGPPDVNLAYSPMRDALESETRAKGTPSTISVGHVLRRMKGRIVSDKAIDSEIDPHTKVQRWFVRTSVAPMPPTVPS